VCSRLVSSISKTSTSASSLIPMSECRVPEPVKDSSSGSSHESKRGDGGDRTSLAGLHQSGAKNRPGSVDLPGAILAG